MKNYQRGLTVPMTSNIVQWLETKFPNQLPIRKISEYELGVLVGQQIVIEDLKIKLEVEEVEVDEVK